jgi:hypothetical protein
MTQYSSSDPNLAEVLYAAIDRVLSDVHTSMPGIIVSYDPSTQTAEVQPALKRKYASDPGPTTFPTIKQVPVQFPSFNGGWLRFPLAKDDTVMLHFSERSIGPWLQAGGIVDPLSPEKFAMKDAVATVGLNTLANAIKAKGASTSVELAFGKVWIELTREGKVKVTNGVADLLGILDNLMTQLSTATAPPPSYMLTMPGLPALQLLLGQLKA